MSTYANVVINGEDFCVTSDGRDWESIRDSVKVYVGMFKGKVKSGILPAVVLDAIIANSAQDFYAPFRLGSAEFASYHWEVSIGPRGGVKVRKGGE